MRVQVIGSAMLFRSRVRSARYSAPKGYRQTAALKISATILDIVERRPDASVLLIKEVGGGWDVRRFPHV